MAKIAHLTSSAPVLLVHNVVAAANHYRDALGFTYERFWGEPPDFVILRRDALHVMLSLAPLAHAITPNWKVNGIWNIYFWVDDVDALFSNLSREAQKSTTASRTSRTRSANSGSRIWMG